MQPRNTENAKKVVPAPKDASVPAPAATPGFAALVVELNTALDIHGAAPGIRNAINKFTASVLDLYSKDVKKGIQQTTTGTSSNTSFRPAVSYASAARATGPEHQPSPKELRELLVRCPKGVEFDKNRILHQVNTKLQPATNGGKFDAARQLPSGDVILVADTAETKTRALACAKSWENAIGPKASIAPKRYAVLVHGLRTTSFPNEAQEENKTLLMTQNPSAKGLGNIVKTTWRKRTLRLKKKHSSLLVDCDTPELANHLINSGIVLNDELHDTELFDSKCLITRCYKCQGYGHTAVHCRKPAACSVCSSSKHGHMQCKHTAKPNEHRCANCGEGHAAGHQACAVHQMELRRVEAARAARPRLFAVLPGGTSRRVVLPTTGKRPLPTSTPTPTRTPSAPSRRRFVSPEHEDTEMVSSDDDLTQNDN